MRIAPAQVIWIGAASTLLAACGGGTSSTPPGSSNVTTPVSVVSASSKPAGSSAAAASSAGAAPVASSAAPKPAAGSTAAVAAVADPCALITKDEAAATLGLTFAKTDVARGGSALGGHGADCNYDGALPSDPSLTLHTMTGAEFQADRSIPISQWVKLNQSSKTAQAVNGVGDAAFWDDALQTLTAVKGDFWMELITTDIGKKYQFKVDAATALAQKAVARL